MTPENLPLRLTQEIEQYLRVNYPTRPEQISAVLEEIKATKIGIFLTREKIVAHLWYIKAIELAESFSGGLDPKEDIPNRQLPTVLAAIRQFNDETFPEDQKDLGLWDVTRILAKAELTRAREGTSTAKVNFTLEHAQKAMTLLKYYETIADYLELRVSY